jgi:hypothetical protein
VRLKDSLGDPKAGGKVELSASPTAAISTM